MLVMGKLMADDTSWVDRDLPDWDNAIYVVNNSTASLLHTPTNKGREANPYLYYILENYDKLRDVTVFLHANRKGAWHNDAPGRNNIVALRSLKLDYVLSQGYANLRCAPIPGCPAAVQPFTFPPDPNKKVELHIAEAWRYIFPGTPVPHTIGVACCAQFAVSRKQIRARPKEDYERIFRWLMETPLEDEISGRLLECLWHVIFGREAQHCPDRMTCLCDTFRMCSSNGVFPFSYDDDGDVDYVDD